MVLEKKQNDRFWTEIKNNPVSDHVAISIKETKKLAKLFHIDVEDEKHRYIPADLIFAGTIPISSLRITITDFFEHYSLENGQDANAPKYLTAEVHIFNFATGPKAMINAPNDANLSVGAVVYEGGYFQEIGVSKGIKYMFGGRCGADPAVTQKYVEEWGENYNSQEWLACEVFTSWYAIQIALLNPQTQVLFKNPAIYTEKKSKGKKGKRRVKYIRKHYITEDSINSLINQRNGKRIFTCLAWYVCGHWRTYKSGRRIFIQPYWKGEMREARAKLDGLCREREIAQLSKEV